MSVARTLLGYSGSSQQVTLFNEIPINKVWMKQKSEAVYRRCLSWQRESLHSALSWLPNTVNKHFLDVQEHQRGKDTMKLLIDQQADAVHGLKHTLCSHWPIRTACPTCVCRRSKKSCQRGFVVLWLLIDLLHWQSLPLSNIQLFDNYCCYSAISGRQGESFQSIIEDGIYFCCLFSPGGFRMTQFERNHTERCVTGTVARSQVTVCLGRPTCLSVSDTTKSGGC